VLLAKNSYAHPCDAFSLLSNISAAVLVISEAVNADLVASIIKRAKGDIPVICLTPSNDRGCLKSDYTISSFRAATSRQAAVIARRPSQIRCVTLDYSGTVAKLSRHLGNGNAHEARGGVEGD
jgi:hypothetical protein